MGRVLAAYDPQLDRKVALKVLKPTLDSLRERRDALLHEAQALARISHQNVVSVFEVGWVGGQLFLAMEFIEGVTLAQWLRQQPRSWQQMLAVFEAAARGLAAAHAQGIVHRDFKPDNVMVAHSGRVCVTDFGLASFSAMPVEQVAGTPRYMAPEQVAGSPADPRADLFSFCVSLGEALSTTNAPKWLRSVVARGAAESPSERYDSIDQLLVVLRPRKRRGVVRTLVAAAAAAFVAVLAAARNTTPPCDPNQSPWAPKWSSTELEQVRAALTHDDADYARDTATRVTALLDGWVAAWRNAYQSTCEATHVRREQSASLLDRRMHCLRQSSLAFEALRRAFASSQAQLPTAVRAAEALPAAERCLGPPETQPLERALSSAERAAFDEVEERLANLCAAIWLGELDEVKRAWPRVVERARAVHHVDATAEALFAVGEFQARSTALRKDAVGTLEDAIIAAEEAQRDDLRAKATCSLAWVVVHLEPSTQARTSERLSRQALAIRNRRTSPEVDAYCRHSDALAAEALGQTEQALKAYADAEAFMRSGGQPAGLAAMLINHSRLLMWHKRMGEALVVQREALELAEQALGLSHPLVETLLSNQAYALTSTGQPREAIAVLARAQVLREKLWGADSIQVATGDADLGSAFATIGDWQAAEQHHRRAVEGLRRTAAPASFLAATKGLLAADVLARGDPAQAHSLAAQAVRGLESAQEAPGLTQDVQVEPTALPDARVTLARALFALRRPPAEVRLQLALARATYLRLGSPEHLRLVDDLSRRFDQGTSASR